MPTEPKPRVTMLVDALSDATGGAERFAAQLAIDLPAERFDRAVCCTREFEPGRLTERLDAGGVRRLQLSRGGAADVLAFRRLTAHLRGSRVDVLHAHKHGSNIYGSVFGRLAGVPVVVAHEHTWSYVDDPLRIWLDRNVVGRLADRFVAVSELDRRRMTSIEGVPAARTLHVPTGYVPQPPDGPPGTLRAELGIAADALVVGTLAVLRPQKRLDRLIEAFAHAARAHPDAVLVIGGDGPDRATLAAAADRAGVADRTHFLGHRRDVTTVLQDLDVAAMSSDFEGMPLFMLEALGCGVCFVGPAVGGIPDVVRDGEGELFDPRDEDALGTILARLLGAPDLRAQLARAGRARAAEFTMPRIAERFGDLYDTLLARRHRG